MTELGLRCTKFSRRSRYNSYVGTVGKVAKNRLNRRFSTPYRLKKLATDISEFKCLGEEKLYFSPIIDHYNCEIISYGISRSPNFELVVGPLKEAIAIVKTEATYRTTIHSDQGWHYQNRGWVALLEENRIFQSMSRKSNCLDNAVTENFFGLIKQEIYYGAPLKAFDELRERIEWFVHYYNHERRKKKLAGLSPVNYRTQTSQQAA